MKRVALGVALFLVCSSFVSAQDLASDGYQFLLAKLAAENHDFGDALSRMDRLVEKDPSNPVLLFERASMLLEAGKSDRALSDLRRVVTLDPRFYEAQHLLGRVLLDMARESRGSTEEAIGHLRAAYELRPDDISTGLTLSQVLVSVGKVEDAAKILAALAEEAPDQRIVNYTYAQVLSKLGRGNEAGTYLERVLEADPTFGPAVFQLIDIYREQGEMKKAADILQPLIEQEPLNLDLQRQQALLLLRAGDSRGALTRLQEIAKADPKDVASRYYMAEALSDLGQHEEAEKYYRQALEAQPRDPDYLLGFAVNQIAQKRYEDAAQTLNTLLALPNLSPGMQLMARTQLALLDYEKGDYAESLRRAKELLSLGKQLNPQAISIALNILRKEKKYDEGLELIGSLLKDHPDEAFLVARQIDFLLRAGRDAKAREIADRAVGLGKKEGLTAAEAYVESDHYAEAIAILNRILEKNPGDYDVQFDLAAFSERAGKQKEAEKLFLQLLEKKPDHGPTLNYLGYMWAEEGVNLDRAAEMLVKAVNQEPDNGAFVDSLGWVYFKQGKLDLAEKYLIQASNLLPSDPTVQEHLGDLFLKRGDPRRALERYRNALTLNPEEKDETKIRAKIAGLEKK